MTKVQKPTKPCYVCGSSNWWLTSDGRYLCGRCHPNPNPGFDSVPSSNEGKYSSEVLALRDRVISGNKKLNDAWEQICQVNHESQEWEDLLERWHQANERLSLLCTELQAKGYEDCLYLDSQGRKTVKCLEQSGIGCRVCPSTYPYWEKELMELPSVERS